MVFLFPLGEDGLACLGIRYGLGRTRRHRREAYSPSANVCHRQGCLAGVQPLAGCRLVRESTTQNSHSESLKVWCSFQKTAQPKSSNLHLLHRVTDLGGEAALADDHAAADADITVPGDLAGARQRFAATAREAPS